eukprot:CAMPEP_0201639378 /NCGR_PEP_ID=MMETSP0493-20130528/19161_1 /ASSEMBLY_ACC=CAM_ASM_000838 /TAXON_ID=420259 /ORGANISM="Thalassiosira gravida, Strain GMp14c1" /LENGTH=54 /DNA_ID=CAMNT_0048112761 /DNA_START=1 /DNA_END=161 /DNA_ORIENTATION=-
MLAVSRVGDETTHRALSRLFGNVVSFGNIEGFMAYGAGEGKRAMLAVSRVGDET